MKWNDIMLSILIILSYFMSYILGTLLAYRNEIKRRNIISQQLPGSALACPRRRD